MKAPIGVAVLRVLRELGPFIILLGALLQIAFLVHEVEHAEKIAEDQKARGWDMKEWR